MKSTARAPLTQDDQPPRGGVVSYRALAPRPWTTDADHRSVRILDAYGKSVAWMATGRPLDERCADAAVIAAAADMMALALNTIYALREIAENAGEVDLEAARRAQFLADDWERALRKAQSPPRPPSLPLRLPEIEAEG